MATKKPRLTSPRNDNLARDSKGRPWTSAEVKANPEMHLSLRQISALVGSDRRAVQLRIDRYGVRTSGCRNGHPVWAVDAMWDLFKPRAATAEDVAAMRPMERLQWLRGTSIRNKLDADAASLVTAADRDAERARVVALTRALFERIPGELRERCGLPPAMVDRVRTHLVQAVSSIDEASRSA